MEILDGLLSRLGMGSFAVISLVFFFCAFLGIIIWIWTRPKKEMDEQSRLWEDDED